MAKIKYVEKTNTLVLENVEMLFSNLNEAKGFNETDENKTYGATFKITGEGKEEVLEALKVIENTILEAHRTELGKAKAKNLVQAPLKIKDLLTKEGEETGDYRLDAKRKERFGTPAVFNKDNEKLNDVAFIRRGSVVMASIKLRPYVMGQMIGISYTLEAIKILQESERSTPLKAKAEDFGFDVSTDLDKLPF